LRNKNAEAIAELFIQGVKKMKIFTNYICFVLLIGAIIICLTSKPYVYPVKIMSSPSSEVPSAESNWQSLGTFIVTAYCACPVCCGEWADKRTACGYNTSMGGKFVAAPVELRFTSVLFIPYYGTATVLDRGGSIRHKRIDVYFPTHQEALEWGRKELEIFIYE